jgi:hypothetical protein
MYSGKEPDSFEIAIYSFYLTFVDLAKLGLQSSLYPSKRA